jgi:hypothetical protein
MENQAQVTMESPDAVKAFETETCTRCGGSGHYSYCSMYGTTCFKCRGKGNTYSKRGEAALAYARELRTVPASEIQVGWLIWQDDPCLGGFKPAWYLVESIGEDTQAKWWDKESCNWKPYWQIKTRVQTLNTFSNAPIQAVPTKERLADVKALALAYQDTLTKQGKPMKRAKVAA